MWKIILSYTFLLFNPAILNPIPKKFMVQEYGNNSAVKLLQEYIQIDTSLQENIEIAVNFWRRQANASGLQFAVYRPSVKPICVLTWPGTNPKLPSIIVNSHVDVVTAAEQDWKHDPYSGYIDDNGDMYGRGTQDTKSLSITYLEAIRKLRQDDVKLQRTVHILLMPDEETGGLNGMVPFIETEEFKALNPGFFFDEGLSTPDGTLYASYQDKRPWQLNLTVHGDSGHGSTIPDVTAMEKGGTASNIIPSRVNVVIDMRLSTAVSVGEVETLIQSWIEQVGNDTELSYIRRVELSETTLLDGSNPYWEAVAGALRDIDLKVVPIVLPATSDMVVVRNRGYQAIGFAYRPYTVSRIHAADEYINIATFLRGIDVQLVDHDPTSCSVEMQYWIKCTTTYRKRLIKNV